MPVPHPIPYQGSKRRIAPFILALLPSQAPRLVEPFAGSAAVTLAAASRHLADEYYIADSLAPLIELWQRIVESPHAVIEAYERSWAEQLGNERAHYELVRERFNLEHRPADLLYLMARCVKGAVRFNSNGEFNQAADHRRRGMHPDTMSRHILGAHGLLSQRSTFAAGDYKETLAQLRSGDVLYMDPPYQGVSGGRDRRYYAQVDVEEFIGDLRDLCRAGATFALSYDGMTGGKEYGIRLPDDLNLRRILIPAGRSAQATLNGGKAETVESVYLSPSLCEAIGLPAGGEVEVPQETQMKLSIL